MKSRLKIPYKWAIFICLLIIPYYIHAARIDRILNNYTQKSNAIFIILQEQVSKKLNTLEKYELFLDPILNICHTDNILYIITFEVFIIFSQIKKLFIYSDLPPPSIC